MEGTVKFFNKLKGFGFIKGEDEKDYFVHMSEIKNGVYLQEGDKVSFEGINDQKGLKAKSVELIGKATSSKTEDTTKNKDSDFSDEDLEEETDN